MARILIVEDDFLLTQCLVDLLGGAGFEVVGCARRVGEAVRMAEALRPDVALMDIRLSGRRDGIDGAVLLRRHCGVPVVFLTSESDPEIVERARSVHCAPVLQKPCPPLRIVEAIDAVFRRI